MVVIKITVYSINMESFGKGNETPNEEMKTKGNAGKCKGVCH